MSLGPTIIWTDRMASISHWGQFKLRRQPPIMACAGDFTDEDMKVWARPSAITFVKHPMPGPVYEDAD